MTNIQIFKILDQIKEAIANDYFITKTQEEEFNQALAEIEVIKIMLEMHKNKES